MCAQGKGSPLPKLARQLHCRVKQDQLLNQAAYLFCCIVLQHRLGCQGTSSTEVLLPGSYDLRTTSMMSDQCCYSACCQNPRSIQEQHAGCCRQLHCCSVSCRGTLCCRHVSIPCSAWNSTKARVSPGPSCCSAIVTWCTPLEACVHKENFRSDCVVADVPTASSGH